MAETDAQPSKAGRPGTASGLRIALFSGNYNCVRDGANKALNRLAGFLLSEGAAVRIYSPTSPAPAFPPVGDLVSVPSFPIPMREEYRIAPRLTRGIKEDIRRFRPTHFHLSAPDWLGTSAQAFARELGVPVVASLHTRFETYLDYYHLTFIGGWMRRRLDRFYRDSDYILCPNAPLAESFRAEGLAGKVGIWARGVDRTVFTPARRDAAWRRELGYAEKEAVILFFGRLVLEKGIEIFVETVDALRRRGRALRPLVVGDGPAAGRMSRALPDARFTGHLEGAALGRAIASADILVNPSVTEAFGNVNLEAMASGLGIVSADVDSARALIRDGEQGLLVPPKDVSAYADAVERLLDDAGLRRRLGGEAHRESANYSWPEALRAVVDAYRRTAMDRSSGEATESPVA